MSSAQNLQAPAGSRDSIKCNSEEFDCLQTFSRLYDMHRHKREFHTEPKKCPWCNYSSKRDGRVLDHIDEKHRPKPQRYRSGEVISRLYQEGDELGEKSLISQDQEPNTVAHPTSDFEIFPQHGLDANQGYPTKTPESQGKITEVTMETTIVTNQEAAVPCPRCGQLPASALHVGEQEQLMSVPHDQMAASIPASRNSPADCSSLNHYANPEVRYAFSAQPIFIPTPLNFNYDPTATPASQSSSIPWRFSSQLFYEPWTTASQPNFLSQVHSFQQQASPSGQLYTSSIFGEDPGQSGGAQPTEDGNQQPPQSPWQQDM